MAMVDMQRKSWQTKAHIATLPCLMMIWTRPNKFIILRHQMSILTMESKNLNWSILMT